MNYENLEKLNESYKNGTFEFPDSITVGDASYHYARSSDYSITEMIKGKKGMITYIPESKEYDDLLFAIGINPHKIIQLNEAVKKKAKAKKKLAKKPDSKGPDISSLKGSMKNTMDKHKLHIDKHVTKHNDVLKDLKKQMKELGGANKGELEKTIVKVEDMLTKHKGEMDNMASVHDEKIKGLDDAYKELIKTHNDAIEKLGSEHSGHVDDLKSIANEFIDSHEERMDHLKGEHEKHRKMMKGDHDEHLKKVMSDHDDRMYNMKRDHGDKMFDMKRYHGEQLKTTNQGHEDKMSRMSKSHEENQEQMQMKHKNEMDNMQQNHEESKIGTEAHVKILNLHSSPALKAKVDTGATICSLHADKIKVKGDQVLFTNNDLSRGNTIRMPLAGSTPIRSADGGMQYRHVIKLNIQIKDKILQNIDVNLNDRDNMEHGFLIGHNALEQGKFIIDPSYVGGNSMRRESEEIDFDDLQEIFEDE